MKELILSLQIFRSFYTKKTALFVIVMFGFAFSIFGILFYASYFAKSYYDAASLEEKKVVVHLEDDVSWEQLLELKDLFKDVFRDNKTQRLSLYEKSPTELAQASIFDVTDIPVVGELLLTGDSGVVSGRYVSEEETEDSVVGTFTALEILRNNKPIGSTITIRDTPFQIIGALPVSDLLTCFIIPYGKFAEYFQAEYIVLEFTELLSPEERTAISEILDNNQWVRTYQLPQEAEPFSSSDFRRIFMQAVLVFILSILNIFGLVIYWIDSNTRTFDIYMLLGCGSRQLTLILVMTNLHIILLSTVLGIGLFMVFRPFIYAYEIIELLKYRDFAIIILIAIAIAVILSLIISVKYRNKISVYRIQGE